MLIGMRRRDVFNLRRIGFLLMLLTLPNLAQAQNPAIIPAPATPQIWASRWQEKLERVKKGSIDLIFVGDSISHAWDDASNYPVWSAYYEPRNAVSLGFSGARTENILWMLENGIVEGISPKVAVVMIGTNNTDGVHFPVANTPEQIAEGITKIVSTLRQKLPKTKILLLHIFPRDNIPGTGEASKRASELVSHLHDGKNIYFLDITKIYLKPDGKIDPALMPDLLHPNAVGNLLWAQAMEPTLRKLMGKPQNIAAVPAEKCEADFYDWYARHIDAKAYVKKNRAELVFVGDSITHMFGGSPTSNRILGGDLWQKWYGYRKAINLGFGFDRTQQVLWRLAHGELEGSQPKALVLLIGTNNLTPHAVRANTNEEIIEGIDAICKLVHRHSPKTKIVLMGLLPRGEQPNTLYRVRVSQINAELAKRNGKQNVLFFDLGSKLLDEKGVMLPGVTTDFLHLSEKGYGIWAESLEPLLKSLLQE